METELEPRHQVGFWVLKVEIKTIQTFYNINILIVQYLICLAYFSSLNDVNCLTSITALRLQLDQGDEASRSFWAGLGLRGNSLKNGPMVMP